MAPRILGRYRRRVANREELLQSGEELVSAALRRLQSEGISASAEDLRGYGRQGLLEAAERYEPERGDFRRFAYYRVRGAMVDGLRKMGPWSRRGYERVALMHLADSASESLQDAEPVEPASLSGDEAAERLRQHMAALTTAMTIGVFAEAAFEGDGVVAKDQGASAEENVSHLQLQQAVREAVRDLPEPDSTVVRRHYLQGERFDHIAEDLDLSKSWVSRIHARALKRLGLRLRQLDPDRA